MYAWIIPHLDSNIIHLTHNKKDNNNPKYLVDFATFVDDDSNILVEMNKTFYIYTRNGGVEYKMDVVYGNNRRDSSYF